VIEARVNEDRMACILIVEMPRQSDGPSFVWADDREGSPTGSSGLECLSERELAVTRRAIAGLSLKTIASELEISPNTAATYLMRARRKLRQTSRWKLTAVLSGPLPTLGELAAGSPFAVLSPSDGRLGEQLLAGLSNAEIACQNGTSAKVAARQVAGLLRKLGITTRLEFFSLTLQLRAVPSAAPCNKNPGGRHDQR
jgi:DNA-binding CsgD family transcriptional regulator